MQFYKTYLETRNKMPICTNFQDPSFHRTYEELTECPEAAGVLCDDVIMVDIDDPVVSEIVLRIIMAKKIKCRATRTTRGIHFLFDRDNYAIKCVNHAYSLLGVQADYKAGNVKGGCLDIIKSGGQMRPIIKDDADVDIIPIWLLPVTLKKTTAPPKLVNAGEGDGRNQELFRFLGMLKRCTYIKNGKTFFFNRKDVTTAFHIINKHIFKEPLPDEEIAKILRDDQFEDWGAGRVADAGEDEGENEGEGKGRGRRKRKNADAQPTAKGRKPAFQHDVFAKMIIEECNIKKIWGSHYIYKDGIYISDDSLIFNAMLKHQPLTRNQKQEVISYIRDSIVESVPLADPDLIAFSNGIYNIKEDKLLPFDPTIILVNKIPHPYDPAAYEPLVDDVLNRIACNDKEVRALMEEAIGYIFYRQCDLGGSFFLIGDRANGKSTYIKMLQYTIGENNISAVEWKDMPQRFKSAQFFCKLANIADDISDEYIRDTSFFRKLVTGGTIDAEFKYIPNFTFTNYAKFMFSANTMPRINDRTGATLRRIVFIPFNATFTKHDPDFDPDIIKKLCTPSGASYLIRLGIEGLRHILTNKGFTECKLSRTLKEEYEILTDPVKEFIKAVEDGDVPASYGGGGDEPFVIENHSVREVYDKYKDYSINNGRPWLADNMFGKMMRKNGYERTKRYGKLKVGHYIKINAEEET